jgi:hypothetical protein
MSAARSRSRPLRGLWPVAVRALALALGLALAPLPWTAQAKKPEHGGAIDRVLVVHTVGETDLRDEVAQRIREHTRADVQIEWLPAGELSSIWEANTLTVTGPDHTVCEGDLVSVDAMSTLAEQSLYMVRKSKAHDALAMAEKVEEAWPCLYEVATSRVLQRTAIVRAWLAFEGGDGEEFERALRQAAAMGTSIPGGTAALLPPEFLDTFDDFVEELPMRPTWDVTVVVEGRPIEVAIDGRTLPVTSVHGVTMEMAATLPPGNHLLQGLRADKGSQSVVLHLGDRGGTVRVHAATPMTESEVLYEFEQGLAGLGAPAMLQALLSEHPDARKHAHVVLAGAERTHEQVRLRIAPLQRTAPGAYEPDAALATALTRQLDAQASDVKVPESPDTEEKRGPPGAWALWGGGSVGLALIHGFLYVVPTAEIGLETPVWASVFVRPSAAIYRGSHGYVQGSVSAFAAFTPRIKRVRFSVHVGGELRGPDHRFESTGIHPVAGGGVSLHLGKQLFVGLSADVVLYQVHDTAVRLSFSREFGLRKKRASGGAGTLSAAEGADPG